MSVVSALANDIEDELRAKNLSHFVLRKESTVEDIVIEIYENQSWHPVLQTWGSVVGVHLNAVLDRSPYTDESGARVLHGNLNDLKPLNKYMWQGEWMVRVDNATDNAGFQYAASWSLLSNKYKPATSTSSLMYVRRRRFTRHMVVDPDPPSKALPFELTIKTMNANLQGVGSVTHAYVDLFLDKRFVDRTNTGAPIWNHRTVQKTMEIDPEMTITFVVYSKKTFTVVNPFQTGQAPAEMVHRGTAHVVVSEFLDNLNILNKEEDIDIIAPVTNQKVGTLRVRLDVAETKLFAVVSAVDDSMEELQKRTEEALPFNIRYDVTTLDNDDGNFLKVTVKNLIEGRDVMTGVDLVDIISESAFLQNVDLEATDDGTGKPRAQQQTTRYPSCKPRFWKLITLPSTLIERNNVSIIRGQLSRALLREEELQARNEVYAQSIPAVSSIFEPFALGTNGFDLAYQPSQQDAAKSDYYDLVIYCLPEEDGVDAETAHLLRWTSYYDYVMMLRELVRIQHQFYRDEAVNHVVRHTCKVLYGALAGGDSKPSTWIPVSFTVDSEAEFLVIRESRVARDDQPESFDKIISFDQVDGIVARNTYHLNDLYTVEMRVHSATSMHVRDAIANVHIETTDGRQRFTYKSEPFRRGSVPEGSPGTVTFQDTFTFMLPPSVMNPRRDPSAREVLHLTLTSDENPQTDTSAVNTRMDIPFSSLLPSMAGEQIADCQMVLRNTLQNFELRLKVNSINNIFWKDPAHLFNIDFQNRAESADSYFVVYFADENGQIIPLKEGGNGAVAAVTDLANNLVYLSTAGMVGTKAEGTSVIGNVARDLAYLGTAGMVGGKHDPKAGASTSKINKREIYPAEEPSGPASGAAALVGNVANNLLYVGTAGTFGKASGGKGEQKVEQNTPRKPGAPAPLDRRNSTNATPAGGAAKVARVAENAASGLLSLGAAGIHGTTNVIAGTSNAAVNVLTLGNANIISSMNKADVVYVSAVAGKTLNPTWDEEVVLSTEQYGDVMRRAKFLLVEVWDKKIALADECLGEVFIPIVCAHNVDTGVNTHRLPPNTGLRKYPVQLSKHMKIDRQAAKRLPNGLGTMRAQLFYQDLPFPPNSTSKERGEDDPIRVHLLMQAKPVGALDFAWPSRIISSEQTPDAMEQDVLFVRLKHDGLHLSMTLTQTPSDRAKMLSECREKTKATSVGADKNCLCMVVPYEQVLIDESSLLTTDALQCTVTFTRIVTSTAQRGKEVERPAALDLLIGPCPACDVYAILQQRVGLASFRDALKRIAGVQAPLKEVDAIASDLQAEILATSHDLEDMSVRTNATSVLENIITSRASTKAQKAAEGAVIFADKTNHMSVTYFCSKLHARVLMVRKALLKTYLWYTLEFSKFSVSKIVGKTVLPNFDKEVDIDAIAVLTKRARSMLKYGDPDKAGDGTDSDDSDSDGKEDEARAAKRRAKKEVSTASLVNRVKDIMAQLSADLRNILFQGYRRKFSPAYVQFLATKLVYEQYLLIVGYLAGILLYDDDDAVVPGNNSMIQSPDRSLSSQMLHLSSVTTAVLTLGAVRINTGNPAATPEKKVSAAPKKKKDDAQKKHELISFVLSQDNLFEQYLHANLFSFENKFSTRPHLSMCLDFDVLISKFADIMNENIQMWNSKALKVFMCRKDEDGKAGSRLPWDITTLKDGATGNELYISHIPESIQIQLNVQIGMKKINTAGMGDTLSIMSIKRIYEINMKIAKAIARAYLSLAVEYENFLEETTQKIEAADADAGNRVTSLIQNIGAKVVSVSTLGVVNVGGESNAGGGAAAPAETEEDSDELLCFLMSIVNDCTRINKEHIPQSVASFVKEFADGGDTVINQTGSGAGKNGSGPVSRENSTHGGSAASTSGVAQGVTAAAEINGYFFNSIKAIKSVSRNAINCLTNQVFFHGDLRNYFLRTFSDHLQEKTTNTNALASLMRVASVAVPVMSPNASHGGESSPGADKSEEGEEEEAEPQENPIGIIIATLQDMYGFTASHVGQSDQHRIVYNCLKKVIMRYLIMLRDILVSKTTARLTSAIASGLNTGLNTSLNTGMKVGRTMLQVTTLGLVGGDASEKGSADNLHDMDKSSSMHASAAAGSTAEAFSPAQANEIRSDLETIMNAHLDVTDDKVAELLQFFNKSVNAVLHGATCDPRMIERILQDRFHTTPPPYNSDPAQYDRILERYIGLNIPTYDMSSEEMQKSLNKSYTIQFQDLTCVNLKDYRLCVVRISFAGITLQSSILSADSAVNGQIRWKDILRFQHVKGYQNSELLAEIVEVRPLGLRREAVLARVRIPLAELSQFINPEPYPEKTGGKIVANPNAGHSGWYVLEEVKPEMLTTRGLTNMLRDATLGTLKTTMDVTNATVQVTANATTAAMGAFRGTSEDGDTLGTSSTSKMSNSSTGKGAPNKAAGNNANASLPPAGKKKATFLSVLSSDQPRDDIAAPQLKIRIRVVEEKEEQQS